jgi:dolichol kinase
VGKKIGRCKWSPSSPKTVEGSASFTASVVAAAWLLRVLGLVEGFAVSFSS